jgi:hypothetical protein
VGFVEPRELRRDHAGVAGFCERHEPDEVAERARLPLYPVAPVEVQDPQLVAAAPREDRLHFAVVGAHSVQRLERERSSVLDLILEEASAHEAAERQAGHVAVHVDAELRAEGVGAVQAVDGADAPREEVAR